MGLIDVSIEGSDVRYSRKIVYVERSVLEDSSAPILPAGNRRGGVELLTELALVLFATVRLLLQLASVVAFKVCVTEKLESIIS